MALPKARPGGVPPLGAILKVWWVHHRFAADNFWAILASRYCAIWEVF